MNSRPVNFRRILALFILATGLCCIGLSFVGSGSNGGVITSPQARQANVTAPGGPRFHRRNYGLADTDYDSNADTVFASVAVSTCCHDPACSIGIDEACVQILDGPCTNMWTYGGTYPGITIRRPTGQTTNVTFTNNLDPAAGELTVHNHGNHSTAANDGQPDSFLIPTGGSRTYIYDGLEDGGNQRGKMQFYHDHRMDVTARNIWMGLTGMYIVDDPADPPTLPSGAFDLPLAIADRQFDANNQIPYVFDPNGVTGDKILD